jgi:4-hydroxy-2-oxoheptanedioate aldolase
MRKSRVLARLREDHPVVFYCLHFIDPSVWEMVSLLGPDCLWLDMEHHGLALETAANLIRATRVGTSDVIARPAKGEFMRMQRMLEVGAAGIMYPRCDNAAEAREVVQWCKFAPLGRRGFDGGGADMPYLSMDFVDYIRAANEQTFIIAQIEDEAASFEAEAILNVPGIDGVMVGRADFSVLEGFPGQFNHPRIQAALDRVAAAARNTGKFWGTTAGDPATARQLVDAGARLLFTGADIAAVRNAVKKFSEDWHEVGIRFEPRSL